MLVVMKFGGSSLADVSLIENAAGQIRDMAASGARVVVALSAMGKTTNDLLALADSVNPKASRRELDMLLSIGEQQSVALMAMALQKMGLQAISLNARQAGISASSIHFNARIKNIDTYRINSELDRGQVVIVAGFQGVNRHDDVVTLGRGSGDVTAVALAAALNADECRIYTDVDGIFTADPRIVPDAKRLAVIGYDEMIEMAALGAKVLQCRSVSLAKKHGVRLVVLSSTGTCGGTIVKEDGKVEGLFISGVTIDRDIARISLDGIANAPGVWFRVFSSLNRRNISADMVSQSITRDGLKDISFIVAKSEMDAAIDALNENRGRIGFSAISHEADIAKLSVISAGAATNPGIPSILFEALYDATINIHMISTSEIRTSVLVAIDDAERAARAVHKKFVEAGYI